MRSNPDYSWLQWFKIKLGLRDNEYDTATPGPSRPMTGILRQIMSTRVAPAAKEMIDAMPSIPPPPGAHKDDAPSKGRP